MDRKGTNLPTLASYPVSVDIVTIVMINQGTGKVSRYRMIKVEETEHES